METKRPPAIKIERVLRGTSQTALAHLSGISQSHIANIENGRRNPSPKTAEAIARVLGVPISNLFDVGER